MCLIALSWRADARFPLVVAANRDEFYRRRSLAADFWDDTPELLAGRDEQAGGTWLGVHTSGRFAAVTNARGVGAPGKQPPSRGELVRDFLNSNQSAADFASNRLDAIGQYAGCNLLLADQDKLFYLTNHPEPECRELRPGRYALSNGHIDDHWPKMRRLAESLNALLESEQADIEALLNILQN
ncbi:MAG: NRDE family protein, partial [Nevskiales bacterium]